ncbi:hypothetical protein J6590_087118 [Homalodisca vitripennis]|nr:hypothetical protein J6590_087118 [Homalodisca vitripennis]
MKVAKSVGHTKQNVTISAHRVTAPLLVYLHTWHAVFGFSFLSVAGMVAEKCRAHHSTFRTAIGITVGGMWGSPEFVAGMLVKGLNYNSQYPAL